MEFENKQRIIQEFVPGKQITMAHLIANPDPALYKKIGVPDDAKGALGILTITPSEAAIIGADLAIKAAAVELVFVDRFSGSLVIRGLVADVEAGMKELINVLDSVLGIAPAPITKS